MITLSIESSCDDTSLALFNNTTLLGVKTASQNQIHQAFGGVVPELAARAHNQNILPLYYELMSEFNFTIKDIELIVVTYAPGLIGSLLVGVEFAKTLSIINNIPLKKVHHLAGHLHAAHITQEVPYPFLGVVVSGGHTNIFIVEDIDKYRLVGYSLDDAAGEAFDKVAKMCNLGYPGGPIIDKLAQKYTKSEKIAFPRPMRNSTELHFSFSGLKTAVSTYLKNNPDYDVERVAASFQDAVIDSLFEKIKRAANEYNMSNIVISGGVAANSLLRKYISEQLPTHNIYLPSLKYCMDNGAMIGYIGVKLYEKYGADDPHSIHPKATETL
ncbi:tRNA (adenosine(37)-N6)-threonylcarbamoyltransferase complex transferase subunit TsaD [bacterium]|nr:tRNA (adenosine(37)-N6)-threonylcarbamoyltransferase complex transferase subunit TsaD [bacterium]